MLDSSQEALNYAQRTEKGSRDLLDKAILNEVLAAYPGLKFVEVSCFMNGVKGYLYKSEKDCARILYTVHHWYIPDRIKIEECTLSFLGKGILTELVKKLGTTVVGRVT